MQRLFLAEDCSFASGGACEYSDARWVPLALAVQLLVAVPGMMDRFFDIEHFAVRNLQHKLLGLRQQQEDELRRFVAGLLVKGLTLNQSKYDAGFGALMEFDGLGSFSLSDENALSTNMGKSRSVNDPNQKEPHNGEQRAQSDLILKKVIVCPVNP